MGIGDSEEQVRAWAEWLQMEMDGRGWRQADLVSNSDGEIKRDRASKWLTGKERPTYRNAIIVANTLGLPTADALEAAGYKSEEANDAERSRRLSAAIADIEKQMPSVGAVRDLKKYSDSLLLAELVRRARERELDVAGGGDAYEVSLDGPRQGDLGLVAKEGTRKIDKD